MADFMAIFGEKEMTFLMKQFKGRCWHCGKVGHKTEDCWSLDLNKGKRPPSWNQVSGQQNNDNNKNQEGGKSKTKCHYCGKPGHIKHFCWKQKRIKKMKMQTSVKKETTKMVKLVLCLSVLPATRKMNMIKQRRHYQIQ